MKRFLTSLVLAALAWFQGLDARADVKPHALISDGMVLQQGVKCPLWGTAAPGEKISWSLELSMGEALEGEGAEADQDGKWRIELPPLKAGGPCTLTLRGDNQITIHDVYIGEVWVASGQSNMEWRLNASANGQLTVKASANPKIRLFTVPRLANDVPVRDVKAGWQECGPRTVGNFSAVAYYFGRDLQKHLNVPLGLIHSPGVGRRPRPGPRAPPWSATLS